MMDLYKVQRYLVENFIWLVNVIPLIISLIRVMFFDGDDESFFHLLSIVLTSVELSSLCVVFVLLKKGRFSVRSEWIFERDREKLLIVDLSS